jgi:hypothetical protein
MIQLTDRQIERFWSRVNKTESCWLWTHTLLENRYGMFGGKPAHRVAWMITNGEIINGLHVLHKCDVGICVRPDHLFLGTHTDNMQDMIKKDRAHYLSGESNRASKLTRLQVDEIRRIRNHTTLDQLSRQFNVSVSTVMNVIHFRTWR